MILDETLGFNINRVAILFRRELIRALKEYGLTPEQWQLLVSLWEKEILSPVEIMDITLQDLPSISRMLQRLERNGVILVEPSPDDKRSKKVSLTQTGRELRQILPEKLGKHFDTLLKNFPGKKQEQLLKLLKELRVIFADLSI